MKLSKLISLFIFLFCLAGMVNYIHQKDIMVASFMVVADMLSGIFLLGTGG